MPTPVAHAPLQGEGLAASSFHHRFTTVTHQYLSEAKQTPDGRAPEHDRLVEVQVALGSRGAASARVLGSDLTTAYVGINCDYRS